MAHVPSESGFLFCLRNRKKRRCHTESAFPHVALICAHIGPTILSELGRTTSRQCHQNSMIEKACLYEILQ